MPWPWKPATATATTSRRRAGQWLTGDRAAQGTWRRRSHGSAERAMGMRTVKHEWGANVIGVVNKCTYCVYTVRCTRNNGHDIHGHSSQPNTLRRTPSTVWEARSERPRPATTRGSSRSLKMSPFDREPTTSYWCSIVTMVQRWCKERLR